MSVTNVMENQKWKFSKPVEFSNNRLIMTGANVKPMSNKITTMIRGVNKKLIFANNPLIDKSNKNAPPIATDV